VAVRGRGKNMRAMIGSRAGPLAEQPVF